LTLGDLNPKKEGPGPKKKKRPQRGQKRNKKKPKKGWNTGPSKLAKKKPAAQFFFWASETQKEKK